jgi:anti-anti-sigma factor
MQPPAIDDPPLAVTWRQVDPETVVVTARGELELYTAARFREETARLIPPGVRRLVLDLAPVRFIDSAGISALLQLARQFRDRGDFCLVAPVPCCRAALELVQLPRLIPTYRSVEEALAALDE